MRVRNGFVSNSSSSSFVVFATKEQIDEAFTKIKQKDNGDKYVEFIKEHFIREKYATTLEIAGKKYLRSLGTVNSEIYWEEGNEDTEQVVYNFFSLIGPISAIESF